MPAPVVTVAQMRDWEAAAWAEGRDVAKVMRLAGGAVARRAMALTRERDFILLLAGSGNNGADTKLAAEQITGRSLEVIDVDSLKDIQGIKKALERKPGLIVDGLFGIGLNRPLNKDWREVIKVVNKSGVPVLAVDVPSGLNADDGRAMGAAIRASVTLTFGGPKVGLLVGESAQHVGRLEVAPEIGLGKCPAQTEWRWVLGKDFEGFPPARSANTHKGDYGHLGIVAGSLGFHGAAVLATQAALKAGPGLVTLVVPENIYEPVAKQLRAPMVHPWSEQAKRALGNCSAVLAGPGLASDDLPADLRKWIVNTWSADSRPMVADASALDWIKLSGSASGFARIVTPHPGEAARLLETSTDKIQADRPGALRLLAQRLGCRVVLKGNHTLIGEREGSIGVNSSGNPFLSQGGSGDVLAGFLAGWLAQPKLQGKLDQLTAYAVWKHGAAADALSAAGRDIWGMDELVAEL
ncbi:MAG: NAD(P)H-hydrate dehydratase [Verrucomicrobiales bacterium]|nr:NAD(P)H-hydrate dehydratase [Verrucomicrobiales bacterium]|tara:strand:+ start:43510 stop:44910 length:1401 start_codon:yes stop_codon:yes gene_type:complete